MRLHAWVREFANFRISQRQCFSLVVAILLELRNMFVDYPDRTDRQSVMQRNLNFELCHRLNLATFSVHKPSDSLDRCHTIVTLPDSPLISRRCIFFYSLILEWNKTLFSVVISADVSSRLGTYSARWRRTVSRVIYSNSVNTCDVAAM